MATSTPTEHQDLRGSEAIEKFRDLVEDIHTVMLITNAADGSLDARPMAAQEIDADGTLWFFSADGTTKVEDIVRDSSVALSYVSERKATYVFARGTAAIVRDRAKVEELWSPVAQAWFDGPEDPSLVLVRVHVDTAEFWNDPAGGIVSMLRVGAKAVGAHVSEGETGRLEP